MRLCEKQGIALEKHLFRMLSAIASFRFGEGLVVRAVRQALAQAEAARVEELRKQVRAGQVAKEDLEGQLFESWDKIADLARERDNLRAELEAQKTAWAEVQNFTADEKDQEHGHLPVAGQSAIGSVSDAVEKAQGQFGATLLFLE